MSTTLSLRCAAPSLDELVEAIGLEDLRVDGSIEPGTMREGVYHMYLDGRSTRATELTVKDGGFGVRIFSLAAPDDVALAVRTIECAAALMGVNEVDAEDAGAVGTSSLGELYDRAWADRQARSGVDILRVLVREGRGPITIPGPRRDYCVGPKVFGKLDEEGPDDTAPDRMLAAIRAVQWLPARTAGTFITKRDDKEAKLAVWLGEEIVFPAVELAAISMERPDGTREVLLVNSAHVPELAGRHWRALDELQGHITALGDAWPAVVEAARPLAEPRPG